MDSIILKADKNGFVNCPFCLKKHKHGIKGGNGHRIPDCNELLMINPVFSNEKWHFKENGYYVQFNDSNK